MASRDGSHPAARIGYPDSVANEGGAARWLAVIVAAIISIEAPVSAAEPSTTGAECPDRLAVLGALRRLGSPSAPEKISEAAQAAGLDVLDLGDRMRVTVAARSREDDPDRDCERRARSSGRPHAVPP